MTGAALQRIAGLGHSSQPFCSAECFVHHSCQGVILEWSWHSANRRRSGGLSLTWKYARPFHGSQAVHKLKCQMALPLQPGLRWGQKGKHVETPSVLVHSWQACKETDCALQILTQLSCPLSYTALAGLQAESEAL